MADTEQPDIPEAEEPKPRLKPDLVAEAIDRGIPSYVAWAMTVPELAERLES